MIAVARTGPAEGSRPHRGVLHTVAANSVITVAAIVLARLMKLAFHVVLSRSAGVAGYGAYTLGFNLVGFVQNFALAGADQTLVRFIPAYRVRADGRASAGLLLTAWTVGTIGSVVVAILLFWQSPWLAIHAFHAPVMAGVLRVFAIALPFFSWIVLGAATAQAFMKPRISALIQDIAFPAAALALLLALGGTRHGLWPALMAFLGACVLAGCLGLIFALSPSPLGSDIPPQPRGEGFAFHVSDWSRFMGAMTVIEISAFVFTGLSPLAVAWFVGVRDAGLYNAALALVAQSGALYAGIAVVVPPTMAGLFARGATLEAGTVLRAATRWLALLAQPFFLTLIALGSLLLGLFGNDFRAGAPLLAILAAGAAVTTITVFTGYALVSAGRQTVDMFNHVGLLAVALAGYPVAAALGGVAGIAVFTAALNVAFSALKTIQVRCLLEISIWDAHLFRVLFLGGVTFGLFAAGGWLGLTATTAGRVAWLATCLAFYLAGALRGLCAEDKDLIGAAIERVTGR